MINVLIIDKDKNTIMINLWEEEKKINDLINQKA